MLAEIVWNIETLAVIGAFGVPLAAIVAYYAYRTAKARADAELKQTLAERGMSADEIERILHAGNRGRS